MQHPSPRAFATDLDGTLTESKAPIDAEMVELIVALSNRMPIAVLSGGHRTQFETQLIAHLPVGTHWQHMYFFPTCAGSCFVYDGQQATEHYSHAFTDAERALVHAALLEALEHAGLEHTAHPTWGERIEHRGAQLTFSGLGQRAPREEKLVWDPHRERRAPAILKLEALLPGYVIRANTTTSIDITKDGIHKAYGIRRYADMVGVSPEDMWYTGDALFPGGNDEVVRETGIRTFAVRGPDDTKVLLRSLIC